MPEEDQPLGHNLRGTPALVTFTGWRFRIFSKAGQTGVQA